jgi:serine/threonine-protein kinase
VEGESLAQLVARSGPLSVRDVVRMLQDVAYALAYAHSRGVVHRDIKPDNIMIERATGRALLMDFGISRSVGASAPTSDTRAGLTRVGEVVGTPEFMSPEQAAGDTLDGRSDLYSLGLVAWFALSGQSAMRGDSTQKVLVKQLTEPVPAIQTFRTDVPASLAAVIQQCTAKSPDERFAAAEQLVEALDVSALRGVEVPLPIRLFAQEVAQVGLVLGFSIIVLVLLYAVLAVGDRSDLDVLLPLVMLSAIVWGRIAQTVHQGRTLIRRGFGVAEIQSGFRALLGEQAAERAQLRADTKFVKHRRRRELLWVVMLVVAFVLFRWVMNSMRVEGNEGFFTISRPGMIIIYAAFIIAGLSVVNLLRSPLRANVGEHLFRLVWVSPIGRAMLALLGLRVNRPTGTQTLPPTRPVTAPAAPVHTSKALPVTDTTTLEDRVAALEQWRRETERH